MIKYKINVLEELNKKGYTTTRLRKEKILCENIITKFRASNTSISCDTLGIICSMLRCQPGDILENVITDEEKIRLF